MKKIFTFLMSALMCTLVFGQGKEAVIAKAGTVKPIVNGVLDDVWTDVEKHDIVTPFRTEAATVGDAGTSYWKALWDDKGMYVMVVVNDNVWSPFTGSGSDYNYDKIEMYFDTNYILEDGVGGQVGTTGNRQIAPNPILDQLDGEKQSLVVQGGTVEWAFKVENPAWNFQIFVPWESIPDKDGNLFDKTAPMGFDVQITDNDDGANARNRVYWSNAGGKDECWNNMDDAGHITLDGVDAAVDISSIAITGGQAISTDNGTVQLSAAVLPANATQLYKWKITSGADIASIDKDGLLMATRGNGTVKVKAVSVDEFVESNEMTITISGQVVTMAENSYIKDGEFSFGDGAVTRSKFWSGGAMIIDGAATGTNNVVGTNPWDWTFSQVVNVPIEMKDQQFVFTFKAWADAERTFTVDFEDPNNNYPRYGVSTDPTSTSGTTDWTWNITTEPTTYVLHCNFTNMLPTCQQKMNFMLGQATALTYIDNVYLLTEADYATSAKTMNAGAMKVYPNPVGSANELYVNTTSVNAKVAIYNSLGQKMMEKVSTGNVATFNVSGLTKGMYMVKLNDGTTQKFVK